jgi:hypothetical protein
MTVLALVLGAAAAAVGTRLAALGFIAAAAVAATDRGPAASIATWSAALAAGWVLLDAGPVRRLALPALGVAAVVVAGAAPNGAVVAGLWIVASAAAAVSAGAFEDPKASRWALSIAGADLALVAALAIAANQSFEGWPLNLSWLQALLLLVAAVARAPLAAGPSASTSLPGLLIVRAQVVVLTVAALVSADPWLAETAIVIGAVGFIAAPWHRRAEVTDVVQELALVGMAAGAHRLGWTTQGWVWGALAAGTLTHYLRFMVGRGTAGRWADPILRAGGLGLPFLPVIAALLEGVLEVRGWPAALLGTGLLLGLGGRVARPSPRPVRRRRSVLDEIRSVGAVGLAVAGGLWGTALSLPSPPAGSAIGWPPPWAPVMVLAAAALGSQLSTVVSPRRGAIPASPSQLVARLRALGDRLEAVDVPGGPKLLIGALGFLALASAGIWIVGLTRGFL